VIAIKNRSHKAESSSHKAESSSHKAESSSHKRSGGFTLLELLVVVALVAILMGTVILGFTGADTEQRLKGQAEQLAYVIEMARQFALQRNREWGLYVEQDGLEFAEFDPEQQEWIPQTSRPFGNLAEIANVRYRVESETLGNLPDAERENLPKVVIFSSGEVTPFTLFLEPEWNAPAWEISTDGLSRMQTERAEF
jgi:general secretion pathway protein H